MNTFGDNLKNIRTEQNISQGKLAELMGIHSTHVSRYERNLTTPSVDVVKKLADILEVSADRLIYGTDMDKVKGRITDTELLHMFSKAQNLASSDIDCIKTFLKAFIFQKDMQKQLSQ